MSTPAWVLGVDVGNSKTHVAVTDTAGHVVGAAAGPGWISGDLTIDSVVDHVLVLVERACGRRSDFAAAAVAMAGLDLPVQEQDITDRLSAATPAVVPAARLVVVNDTFALLRAGSRSGDGVAVVAGAGINCVGVRGDLVVRFHALGRLSGDWGGGYDVGAEALALACRAEDGRGAATVLAELVPHHFGLARPLEVSEAMLAGRLQQAQVIELCPLVLTAASAGDTVARGIVEHLAAEVAAFANTTARRLAWDSGPVPLVLGGGLLQGGNPVLLEALAASLDHEVELSVCQEPPVVGSVLMALDLLGIPAPPPSALAERVRDALAGDPSRR